MEKDQYTISEQMLAVGDGHELYVQVWGNPDAKETHLHLHGGPGSGTSQKHKLRFDPAVHKVIFYDQRGSGNSKPYGSLDGNTTDHLVSDITKILDEFSVEEAVFVGGSWGSTLSLVYGIKHPKRVSRMVLQGIFTADNDEIDLVRKGGFKEFYPEAWEKYTASVPDEHRNDPSAYHIQRILGDDESDAIESALAYANMEVGLIKLDDRSRPVEAEDFDPSRVKLMLHYLSQGAFLPDNYIYTNAHQLSMRIDIVQGRYDVICPPAVAYRLSKHLPDSRIHWTIAGHSGSDRETWSVIRSLV